MKEIELEMVKLIHQLLAEQTGGSIGVRDENLLESAIKNVNQTFDGKELYPTKEEKGARLGFNLVANPAFIDGNKRMGMHIMILFLENNGVYTDYTQKELVELGLGIAKGKIDYQQILEWIHRHKK